MDQLQISVGCLVDRRVYTAICRSNNEICCVVARNEHGLAGLVLVELNRNWIRRRPLLAARMALARYRVKRTASQPENTSSHHSRSSVPYPPAATAPLQWADGAPRVLFIGVDRAWRGQGLGKLLYKAMFEEIHKRGHSWLLARIATDNSASIRLHQETGWVLYEDSGVVFAVRDLRTSESTCS